MSNPLTPRVCLSTQRSLPALRQLTPDSAAFIQQSQQQPPPPASQATTALTAVVLSSSVQRTAGKTAATVTSALQPPVLSLTQPTQVGVGKQGQPTPLVWKGHLTGPHSPPCLCSLQLLR